MDEHFKTAEFDKNMPVVLALLSIWYNNFWLREQKLDSYSQYLHKLVSFTTRDDGVTTRVWVEMESGRLSNRNHYLGEPGTNAQHAFLIHQGTKLIPSRGT
jgi:glucose-6-phosphate isomerase